MPIQTLIPIPARRQTWFQTFCRSCFAILFSLLTLLITSNYALAETTREHPVKNTAGDLSDIPNLEQMDYDKFEEYFGDVPSDRKPLFNPDSPRANIENKSTKTGKTITPKDLKEDPSKSAQNQD